MKIISRVTSKFKQFKKSGFGFEYPNTRIPFPSLSCVRHILNYTGKALIVSPKTKNNITPRPILTPSIAHVSEYDEKRMLSMNFGCLNGKPTREPYPGYIMPCLTS